MQQAQIKKWLYITLLGSVMILNTALFAGEVSFGGYYKLFFMGLKLPALTTGDTLSAEPAMGSVNNRVRLKLSVDLTSWLSFQGAYDFAPRIQDPELFQGDVFFSAIDVGGYRVDDFAQRLYPRRGESVSSFGVFHNVDRFLVTLKTSFADIFIGRQAIAWGSAKFFNPTDIIAPFSFNELDTEERKGVDAIRVRVPLGMMDELDMGFIAGRDFKMENSAYFLRGRFSLLKTDISLLVMGFRENLLMGVDVTRAIGGAGFWLEAAYVKPDFFASDKPVEMVDTSEYFQGSVGMDYNFNGNLYGFFEYHFNGAGQLKIEDYPLSFNTTAYREGAVYLMGKHYLNLGVTYQLTPLIPVTGLVIWNVNDGSFTFAPSLEYNIAENIYLGGGAYVGVGRSVRSEFGAYPDMAYTSFRVYF